MNLFESALERDFSVFVHKLPKLEPQEFLGLCRVLSVKIYDENAKKVEVKIPVKGEEGKTEKKMQFPPRKTEDILNDVMDRFLELPKRRRREINQIIKDAARGL